MVLCLFPSPGHSQFSDAQLFDHLLLAISGVYLLCLGAILLAKDAAKSAMFFFLPLVLLLFVTTLGEGGASLLPAAVARISRGAPGMVSEGH